jgi:predicted RNA-binding Zn-ribbon protein involved in translation (DUF1610 family)
VLRNLALAIPPGIGLLVMWRKADAPDATLWLVLALFLAWMTAWIVADAFYFRRYRCPTCGMTISRPTNPERQLGDPIVYSCPDCAIEWDTRLRESGGE